MFQKIITLYNFYQLSILDELLGESADQLIIGESDTETALNAVVDSCRNETHFSDNFFQDQVGEVDSGIRTAINQLNLDIFKQFNDSIESINIKSDLKKVQQLINLTNGTEIGTKATQIEFELRLIDDRFENISTSIPTVPSTVVNETVNQVSFYI